MPRTTVFLLILLTLCLSPAFAADWAPNLYLGRGDTWRTRIPITVQNNMAREAKGDAVTVTIGDAPGDADMISAQVESIRVCNAAGVEMLYNIISPDGVELRTGSIPEAAQLILPAECEANAEASYYVYFDNPSAWGVPDFLPSSFGIRNGSFEEGSDTTPAGWINNGTDSSHRLEWTTAQAHTGRYSVKTEVDTGAPSTWVATRQTGLHIIAGARYVMRAWVKAENVTGECGWYIHLGNEKNFMITSPMLQAGAGTYDWKEVTAEFTAPDEANVSDLGTVLYGTGTAWFDDVTLECLDPAQLVASAGPREQLTITESGVNAPWLANRDGATPWAYRIPVRVTNYTTDTLPTGLIAVDLAGVFARLRNTVDRSNLTVSSSDKLVASYQLKDMLLFEGAPVPANTVHVYYIYLASGTASTFDQVGEIFSTDAVNPALPGTSTTLSGAGSVNYEKLLQSPLNMVRNPSFEEGTDLPDDWPGGAEGIRPAGSEMGLVEPGLFGKKAGKISIPHDAQPSWFGWRQKVPVEPKRSYLFAAWLKSEDIKGGLQLFAHNLNAEGIYSKELESIMVGPGLTGTTDWTLLSGLFDMPSDIADFELHLTMNATGTAYHDGVLLVPVVAGQVGQMEPRHATSLKELEIWPVNPIVKVFQDDVPPMSIASANISMARNEAEPLQLALRSEHDMLGIKVKLDAPKNGAGQTLDNLEIGVVGYVPIDYATNYYSNRTPAWVRKFPTSPAACDGWAGMWPDPLLPRDTFDLTAGNVQPVWVTVKTSADAAPGEYVGIVRFTLKDAEIAAVPFRVNVWDFTLPQQNHVAAVYDLRIDGRWDIPGKNAEETQRDFLKFMAEKRVCPDTIRPEPEMRYENGQVIADFTAFDKAAEYYLNELKMPHFYTPWQFYLFGWGFPPSEKFGEQPYEGKYPFEGADRGVLRPEYKKAYQAVLKAYWDHLKEKGWADRCILYISDEPFANKPEIIAQMQALCDMIHEVDPNIPIYCSTWSHIPQWDGYLDVWGIGHYGIVTPEKMAERKVAGDRLYWTTDGQMCTDTPFAAIERLLPHYCFKYGAEAYEFWGISWLTYDPYKWGWHSFIFQSDTPENSYYVRYPNGDGFLAYPGAPVGHDGPVSSVRLEQAREGVEDYEYLYLLTSLRDKAAASDNDTTQADAALALAARLVDIPNAGGRYSTRILPDPDVLLVARKTVAEAIVALQQP